MAELLRQVAEGGTSGSPEFNLGQSGWSNSFALNLFAHGFLDGGGP
jgi:hypothetical protein